MKNDELLKNNINSFEKELKENNRSLYDFMNAHNVKHIDNIFIEFLFNYTLLLQQKDKHKKKYIYFTENDKLLSLIIIKMIQNKLIKNDNSLIYNQIIKFIESNFASNKFLCIILQIIGINVCNLKYLSTENKKIFLGFTNDEKDDSFFTKERDSIKSINYCSGENIILIREEFTYDFLSNLNIKYRVIDNKNLEYDDDNKDTLILPPDKNKLLYEYFIDNISKYKPKDIYLILKYIKMLLMEKIIKLNEKIISFLLSKSFDKNTLNLKYKRVYQNLTIGGK
jgi:hypothetical protein